MTQVMLFLAYTSCVEPGSALPNANLPPCRDLRRDVYGFLTPSLHQGQPIVMELACSKAFQPLLECCGQHHDVLTL